MTNGGVLNTENGPPPPETPASATGGRTLNRLGATEEVAAALLTLCRPGATFIIGVALPSTAATPPVDCAVRRLRRPPPQKTRKR